MNDPDGMSSNDLNNGEESQSESSQNLQDDIAQIFQHADEDHILRIFIENIFNTIYEPILILDAEFNVVLANASFYEKFNCTEKDTLKKSLFTLGGGKWDALGLKTLLEGILPNKSIVQNYKIQLKSTTKGLRTYFINARNIYKSEKVRKFIFLSFDDATDRIIINEQKNTLIREMNHRIKNNLLIIQTLLKLQARDVEDEISKGYFLDTQARVQSISLIHEMLYHATDLSSINFQEYLSKLVRSIASSYKESRIEIDLNVPSVNLDLDKILPIGLIITELVTNAYKYAFPGNRSGRISIDLSCLDNNDFILTVKDDGIGIPGDFDIKKSVTFGMKIVTTLVGQIGGRLEISRDGGSAFVISFRDEKQTE